MTCYVRASTMTRALPYSATVHRYSLQTDRSTSMYVHVRDQTDNATYASTRWVLTVREDKEALPCVRTYSWWVPVVRGRIIFLPVIWTHFLACEDVAGGSQQSRGIFFSHEIRWL